MLTPPRDLAVELDGSAFAQARCRVNAVGRRRMRGWAMRPRWPGWLGGCEV